VYLENPFRWTDPRSWPWFVFVWLAFTAAGFAKPLWRRLKRNKAQGWSLAPGRIESVDARQPKVLFFFAPSKDSSANHLAELKYSYSVAGNSFTGHYEREFPTEWEAWDFLRDLQGKSVTVLINPHNPASSTLSESAVETLLQTRPQISEDELVAANSASSIPLWWEPFLPIFVALSAVGFVVSLWVHIGSMMGRVLPQGFFFLLHVGIFVVWFPAVFVARQKVGNLNRKDFWKRVLRGAPDWMRYFIYGLFVYTFVDLFLSKAHTPAGEGQFNPSTWRQFSAAWMVFYAAAFAILYAASKQGFSGGRCINGHPVSPGANFCTQCGQSTRRSS
jgi:hypothetical protein